MLNNVFDTLNSKSFKLFNYKKPISGNNKEEYFNLYNEAESYLMKLQFEEEVTQKDKTKTVQTTNILLSKIKTRFMGFIIGMQSFKNLYRLHVESENLNFLIAFKFCQDHLETLFSVIRSKGGFNNNPDCVQFKAAFNRILMRNEIRASLNANCLIDGTTLVDFNKSLNISKQAKDNISIDEGCVDDTEMHQFMMNTSTKWSYT